MFDCKIEHLKFAVAATEEIHRFQARMWILPCPLQLRHRLAEMTGVEEVFTEFEAKVEIGRIACDALLRLGDEQFCTLSFGGLQ